MNAEVLSHWLIAAGCAIVGLALIWVVCNVTPPNFDQAMRKQLDDLEKRNSWRALL